MFWFRSMWCSWLCKYAVPHLPARPREYAYMYRPGEIDSTLVHTLRHAQVCRGQICSQLYDTCVSREQSLTPAPGPHYCRKGHNHLVSSLMRFFHTLFILYPISAYLIHADLTLLRLLRLSLHFSQASEALRTWAQGEGDDLSVRECPLWWSLFSYLMPLSGYTWRLYQAPSRVFFFSQTICRARENRS